MRQVWGAIYGRLATVLGWTFPRIDDLLFLDIEDLTEYWRTSPPVHEMVAAYLEYKAPTPAEAFDPEKQQAELEDLVHSLNLR